MSLSTEKFIEEVKIYRRVNWNGGIVKYMYMK